MASPPARQLQIDNEDATTRAEFPEKPAVLLSLLIEKFATAAAAAAALGVSRQAFHQAAKRGRFSDSVILRAAELLGLDASALLLQRAQLATSKPKDSPTPIPCPAPETINDARICSRDTLYYVKSRMRQALEKLKLLGEKLACFKKFLRSFVAPFQVRNSGDTNVSPGFDQNSATN